MRRMIVGFSRPYRVGAGTYQVDIAHVNAIDVIAYTQGISADEATQRAKELAACLWEEEPATQPQTMVCHGIARHSALRIKDTAFKTADRWCGMCQDWFEYS